MGMHESLYLGICSNCCPAHSSNHILSHVYHLLIHYVILCFFCVSCLEEKLRGVRASSQGFLSVLPTRKHPKDHLQCGAHSRYLRKDSLRCSTAQGPGEGATCIRWAGPELCCRGGEQEDKVCRPARKTPWEGQGFEKRLWRAFKVGDPQGPSTEKWPPS